MLPCFHCGLPAVRAYTREIAGVERAFCCVGCQAVASAIIEGGLADFYAFRDSKNKPADTPAKNFAAYDLPEVQEAFVSRLTPDDDEALISIGGISCAACAWLIEQRLRRLAAVREVSVNATTHRCRIVWQKSQLPVSELFAAIHSVGYQPSPLTESEQQRLRHREARRALMRLGVAGIGMMQVGMFAIALHAGDFQGMDGQWRQFFRGVSLLVATPVVFFSAWPFFANARRAISHRQLTMDVPVALAIALAYGASAYATVSNSGAVYFDSIVMFTFFLLLGRYLEMRVRQSSAFLAERVASLLPTTVDRLRDAEVETIPLAALRVGDRICVAAGGVMPCDGRVAEGASSVDESVLTGESAPRPLRAGGEVFAGTGNIENRLLIQALAVGKNTRLAAVERLLDRAGADKPRSVTIADRVASYFVALVLLAALGVGVYWYLHAPEKVLWVLLSVLVATCPCALSLATPAALTAGTLALRRSGVLVSSAQFIEQLSAIDHVVFDKTGTLTESEITVAEIRSLDGKSERRIGEIIAALEAGGSHPIAGAFAAYRYCGSASRVTHVPGQGVVGEYQGRRYKFGLREFAGPECALDYPAPGMWQLLTEDGAPAAWVLLANRARRNIAPLLAFFAEHNIRTELLSGDRADNVDAFARGYGLPARGGALPEDKLEHIRALQAGGAKVLMVGDGINDVPVLKAADLSIAAGDATRLAQTHADAVLIHGDLLALRDMWLMARRVRAKIKQNFAWALLYNAAILPLAAMALVPPYLAAIGMSASSLLVVLNATRLRASK